MWLSVQVKSLRQAFLSAGKFLSLQPQLHISMQERTFVVEKWSSYKTGEIYLGAQAYVFVHISQHGPGEQVVSHRGIWCAPR